MVSFEMNHVPFVFLRARPDDVRGESMNVGLVVFFDEAPRVYLDAPIWRLRALHPDFDNIDLERWATELEATLPQVGDQRAQIHWLSGGLGAISADDSLGHIRVDASGDATSAIEDLLERFVHMPERTIAPPARDAQINRSRLESQLKSWFRSSRVFSSKVSDLSRGRVVQSYPIDVSDDLYADFALTNGAIHIIEALDLRGVEKVTKSVRGEAGLTAVLLDQAKKNLSPESRRIAVTAADNYSVVRSAVHLVSRYADDVVAIESAADRQRLADFIAGSLQLEKPLLPLAMGG